MSGFCALAGEVIWTRLIGLLFGATVYTFAIILAIFLIGLGLGGGIGASLVRKGRAAPVCARRCQMAGGSSDWLVRVHARVGSPVLADQPRSGENVWLTFRVDLMRAGLAILPAALCLGRELSARAGCRHGEPHRDRAAGAGCTAANTLGAVAGALVVSLVLIATIGTQRIKMADARGVVGGSERCSWPRRARHHARMAFQISGVRSSGTARRALAISCAALVPRVPGVLVAYGRYAADVVGHAATSSMSGKARTRRSPCRGRRRRCSTTTTRARFRRRASRRTCGCSGCSAISRRSCPIARVRYW